MKSATEVVIGIPVRSVPSRLARTLENVRLTAPAARIVLIPDAPDDETYEYLSQLNVVDQLPSHSVRGNASCFNRLVHSVRADVYLLLESGAITAPGWLDRMLATFRRVPKCGLTGPSTNRSWNQQCVVQPGQECANALVLAQAVERRYGVACRSLRPLHSLADFCYAVRRDVVETIGDADEGYEAGPCWEMDYNVRAHRARFLGVWTCGAYVHRPEPDGDAPGAEAMLQKNKYRYQDKFCGLRMRGLKSDYRLHCRGDACANFAPAELIRIHLATDVRNASVLELPTAPEPEKRGDESIEVSCAPELPLVSCIMPTCDRRSFVPAAVASFLSQDYPRLELIVVDDGVDSVEDLMPPDSRIRYFRLDKKLNVGAKRNFACEQSRGTLIAHWDDDDWNAPDRIRRQVEAMLHRNFQIGGTTTVYYLHHQRSQAFRYAYRGPGKAWMQALVYTRKAWERIRFEAIPVGEDVRFIARVPLAERLDLNDLSLVVCTIHSSNTSPKVTTGAYWTPEPFAKILGIVSRKEAPTATAKVPLVSCIMPTHNRRPFISLALHGFHAQTYANKELVVVDDGTDPVGDLMETQPGILYARVGKRLTIGAKRNLACELAQGELIAHWDDDDWYAPDRLAYQAAPLNEGLCDLDGLINSHTLELPAARFWSVTSELHQRMFVGDIHGGTLMFAKTLLKEGIRYPEANLAEDAALIRQLSQRKKRILRMADAGLFIYVRHSQNTWKFDPGHFVDPKGWRSATPPENFASDTLEQYREASMRSSGRSR